MTGPPRKRILLAYGILVAVCGSLILWLALPKATDWQILGYKLESLENSRTVIEDGGPVLLQQSGAEGSAPAYSVVGAGDDQGIFVVVPPLTELTGISDARDGLKLLFILMFFPALASYPLVFNRLLDSRLAAFASPLLLLGVLLVEPLPVDIYWLLAWGPLALLPVVLLVDRVEHWRGRGLPILLACALAASFASAIRSQAGLPIVIAAIAVVLLHRQWRPSRRVPAVLCLIAAYLAIAPFGMNLVRNASENWADDHGSVSSSVERSHVFWHSLYIGLGYLPNDEGIIYLDQFADRAVHREDPDVSFLGPGYESTARRLYFDTVAADPGYFAGMTAKKAIVAVGRAAPLLIPLAIGFALLLQTCRFRRPLKRWLLLLTPALLLGLAQGLLVMPYDSYLLGWTGTLDLLLMLVLCAGLAVAESSFARRRRATAHEGSGGNNLSWSGFRAIATSRRGLRLALAVPACVLLVAIASSRGSRLTAQSLEWQISAPVRGKLDVSRLLGHSNANFEGQTSYRLGVRGPGGSLPRAAELDGISAAIVSRYVPFDNSSTQTFEGWAKRSDDTTEDVLLGGTGVARMPFLRLAAGNDDVQFFSDNGGVVTWPDAWRGVGEWVHWALVSDTGKRSAELFIDGASAGKLEQPGPYSDDTGVLSVGARATSSVDPFAGSMAGVSIFPRALQAEEIRSHYEALDRDYSRAVLQDSPSLYWELSESAGVHVKDDSGEGHPGTFSWQD